MADMEPNDELFRLQKRSDSAWADLRAIQDRRGRPSQEGGWSPEAQEEWQAAWTVWGDRVDTVRAAISHWAGESGQRRIDIETRLKGEVRGGKDPQVWPEGE
ncbi:hypothetical protein [Streptomyces sp. NPDC058412]|uniref:hypothetical protein n=1 Tax=Streptomyces sp. NPDC058412 TaxID=3346486 RepID=UPI00365375E4